MPMQLNKSEYSNIWVQPYKTKQYKTKFIVNFNKKTNHPHSCDLGENHRTTQEQVGQKVQTEQRKERRRSPAKALLHSWSGGGQPQHLANGAQTETQTSCCIWPTRQAPLVMMTFWPTLTFIARCCLFWHSHSLYPLSVGSPGCHSKRFSAAWQSIISIAVTQWWC